MARVLVVGPGDMGARIAQWLGMSGAVREVVVAGRPGGAGRDVANVVASTGDVLSRFEGVDGADPAAMAGVVERARPDLVVQCATLLSPWAAYRRDDAVARALRGGGLGVALAMQLPVLLATLRGAREAGYAGPVANLSFPDVTNVIAGRLGLAPTLGLGNAGIVQLRVRAALRAQRGVDAELPVVRVVAQHAQLFGVMRAAPPTDPADRVRVFLGEEGERADAIAYAGPPLEPGPIYNDATLGAVVPVLRALLPGAAPLRVSVPGPLGLPGGYPVRLEGGRLALDLPPGQDLDDAVAFNERQGAGDGVARVAADGTAHVTEAAREAVDAVAPWLAEPLHPDAALERAARIRALVDGSA